MKIDKLFDKVIEIEKPKMVTYCGVHFDGICIKAIGYGNKEKLYYFQPNMSFIVKYI